MALEGKHAFERFAEEVGVSIKEYLADNHSFASAEFKANFEHQRKKLTLSGVGAHHQNRVEQSIQMIFSWAKAMLIHFVIHWPQAAQTDLWPYAVLYAVWIWNNMHNPGADLSPIEIFSGVKYHDYRHLQCVWVFGCPVYVLKAEQQANGKKVPKWSKKARRGIFLGFLGEHHNTVALVLDPETGHISPQYHVVFDKKFTTVIGAGDEPLSLTEWMEIFSDGHWLHESIESTQDDHGTAWVLPPDVDQSFVTIPR
jgi:hypothetical protein